jgi:hypothetical protein
MEATYSSETSVDFQRTARRYIPEDKRVWIQHEVCHFHRNENYDCGVLSYDTVFRHHVVWNVGKLQPGVITQ